MIKIGCDIHTHIEIKMEGKWRHYATPSIKRNYKLFALMANVRDYNDIKPISKPKGIPDDITYLTKIDYERWKADAHNESYLTVEELVELKKKMEKVTSRK